MSASMPGGCGFQDLRLDYYSAINVCAVGDVLSSGIFSAGEHTWTVNCYPRGDEDGNGEYLSLFLQLMGTKSNNVKAIFDAFLMGKDDHPSSSHAQRCVRIYPPDDYPYWGWTRFVKRSDLESSYVIDGIVRIMCVVIVLRDDDPVGSMPAMPVPSSDIAVHLGGLLDRGDATDVSFVVDGETFPAHRAVLVARSPVFRAKLLGSTGEDKLSCTITLHDIDPMIFRALLRFIYTDELPEDGIEFLGSSSSTTMATTSELFQNLLAAADRYDLRRLKLMCADKLWKTVSVDTVATTLVYAEMHGCSELKKRCLEFFVMDKNFKEAVLTQGYLHLMQRFPSIIDEIRVLLRAKAM